MSDAMEQLAADTEDDDDFDPSMEITLDGGQKVSLGDLLGLETEGIARVAMDAVPTGVYHFRCEEAGWRTFTNDDEEEILIFEFGNRVVQCLSLQDQELDPNDYVDDYQKQGFFVQNKKDLGKVLDFMEKAGYVGNGKLGARVKGFAGTEFIAPVITKPSKKDPDFFNARIRRLKVQPATQDLSQQVA